MFCKSIRWLGVTLVLAAALALASGVATAQSPVYNITDLSYGITTDCDPAAFNASGQVVGGTGDGYAFTTSVAGGFVNLSGILSTASGINDNGVIVGSALNSSGQTRAAIYSGGTVTTLGIVGPGGYSSTALAINNAGQVVGQSDVNNGPTSQAFLYSGGSMIGLGCLDGTGADSWATAINDNGEIVGASYPGLGWGGAGWNPHAFVYSNGSMKDLGIIPGTPANSGSGATAVNNAGTIVGYAEVNTTNGTSDPVFWDPDGTIHDLGSLPGGYPNSGGAAYGINNANQVVGSAYNASGEQVGMIYERGQMLDLNTLIDPNSGWTIDNAIAISSTGVILAQADNSNVDPDGFGWGHAVLLSPLPGDANLDGTVDINDLTIVLSNYGKTGATWFEGDFTGSGTVDINDLTIVLANYDQTVGAAGIKAVPEPSCVVLLGISAVGLLGYAWRQRKRNS